MAIFGPEYGIWMEEGGRARVAWGSYEEIVFIPIGRGENTIAVRPRSVIGGHAHQHDLAAVGLQVGEDETTMEQRLLAFQCRAELDHATAKITSSWFSSVTSWRSR